MNDEGMNSHKITKKKRGKPIQSKSILQEDSDIHNDNLDTLYELEDKYKQLITSTFNPIQSSTTYTSISTSNTEQNNAFSIFQELTKYEQYHLIFGNSRIMNSEIILNNQKIVYVYIPLHLLHKSVFSPSIHYDSSFTNLYIFIQSSNDLESNNILLLDSVDVPLTFEDCESTLSISCRRDPTNLIFQCIFPLHANDSFLLSSAIVQYKINTGNILIIINNSFTNNTQIYSFDTKSYHNAVNKLYYSNQQQDQNLITLQQQKASTSHFIFYDSLLSSHILPQIHGYNTQYRSKVAVDHINQQLSLFPSICLKGKNIFIEYKKNKILCLYCGKPIKYQISHINRHVINSRHSQATCFLYFRNQLEYPGIVYTNYSIKSLPPDRLLKLKHLQITKQEKLRFKQWLIQHNSIHIVQSKDEIKRKYFEKQKNEQKQKEQEEQLSKDILIETDSDSFHYIYCFVLFFILKQNNIFEF